MPWPKVPEAELGYIEETEEIDPLYLGPVTSSCHRIVAYHRRNRDGSGYPNVTVMMDKDSMVFDYYDFMAFVKDKIRNRDTYEPAWEAVSEIVTSYYWKMNIPS